MNFIKKIAKQTIIYGVSSVLARILNYMLVPIHTRIFEQNELGFITEIYVYAAFLNIIYTYGMETTYFRFSKKIDEKNSFNMVFSLICISTIFFSSILILFAPQIAMWIRHPSYEKYIYYMICIISLDCFIAIIMSKLRFQNQSKRFVSLQTFRILTNIIISIFLLYILREAYNKTGFNFLSPLALRFYNPDKKIEYVLLANLISSLFTLILLFKTISKVKFILKWKYIKSMLYYSIPLLFVGLAGTINELISRPAIKYLLPDGYYQNKTGEEVLGIFGSCYKLSIFMNLAIQAFRYAVEPFFFKSLDNKDHNEKLATIMHWFIIATCLIMFLVSINLDLISTIMIGPKFRGAIEIVPYLLLGYLFLGIYYNLSIWFKINNKTYYGMFFTGIGTLITISLNFILIPILGYWGAVLTTIISYGFITIISYFFGQKYYKVPYKIKSGVCYIVCTIIVIYLFRSYIPNSLLQKTIYGFIVSLTGIFLILYVERKNIKKIITVPTKKNNT